ncbi:hypothetical protein B0H14DRAFT_3497827 [Mycena olivaceomarginata]|nr:hypothetical protein B0H14DRAFT_3497827 [Mycena olivaceomarginata]
MSSSASVAAPSTNAGATGPTLTPPQCSPPPQDVLDGGSERGMSPPCSGSPPQLHTETLFDVLDHGAMWDQWRLPEYTLHAHEHDSPEKLCDDLPGIVIVWGEAAGGEGDEKGREGTRTGRRSGLGRGRRVGSGGVSRGTMGGGGDGLGVQQQRAGSAAQGPETQIYFEQRLKRKLASYFDIEAAVDDESDDDEQDDDGDLQSFLHDSELRTPSPSHDQLPRIYQSAIQDDVEICERIAQQFIVRASLYHLIVI